MVGIQECSTYRYEKLVLVNYLQRIYDNKKSDALDEVQRKTS